MVRSPRAYSRSIAECRLDPHYRDEVSGCTASVGLISKSNIYVVRAYEIC